MSSPKKVNRLAQKKGAKMVDIEDRSNGILRLRPNPDEFFLYFDA